MAFIISLFVSILAHAQYDAPAAVNFSVQAAEPGCVKVSYFNTTYEFPSVATGEADSIRFYYGTQTPESVTETSPFQEASFLKDDSGSWVLSPNEFCGFKEGHTFFKYGLVDIHGAVIEFQPDFDPYSNAVDVVAPKP